jgi:hypothetical protein
MKVLIVAIFAEVADHVQWEGIAPSAALVSSANGSIGIAESQVARRLRTSSKLFAVISQSRIQTLLSSDSVSRVGI